ncbi:hypothetical protein [Microbacterium sp. CH12i]|uniref:hypothetical protein n=1 Tax=Microbacterium sp. CH12i TaxID=1479651 RepID=UPI0012696485|nr:hypothetical protein [Microbacterium sp. CH12i]
MALAALVVLVPTTVFVIGGNEWQDYFLYRSTVPIDANADGTVELDDTTWGPARSAELDDTSAYTVPAGVRVIVVAVAVDPHGEPPGCLSPQLVEQSTGRQWNEMRSELGIPYSSEESSSCIVATDDEPVIDPYELILAFGVPDDAEGPFWVEVSPTDAIPYLARFSIDP